MHTGYSPNRKVIVLILPINNRFRPAINRHIQEEWCGPLVVTRGVIHDTSRAEGFMATDGDALLGYVLYAIENGRCEILVLHSLQEHCGIGKALIDAVLETAKTHMGAAVSGSSPQTTTCTPSGITSGLDFLSEPYILTQLQNRGS